jgi:DNA-directed RNA polymerase sigma subunit (sigma70/sigma32)
MKEVLSKIAMKVLEPRGNTAWEYCKESHRAIIEAMATLTMRESLIIILRAYGYKLNDIAKEFNLSGARISQLERKAYRKMTHPMRMQFITPYIKSEV